MFVPKSEKLINFISFLGFKISIYLYIYTGCILNDIRHFGGWEVRRDSSKPKNEVNT